MDKRTVSAVFLIILVIMAYQLVILPMVAPPPSVQQQAPLPEEEPSVSAPPPPPPQAPVPQSVEDVPVAPPAVEVPRHDSVVDRPLYRASVDNLRGGFKSWKLHDYTYSDKTTEAPGEPVELLPLGKAYGALGIAFTDTLSEGSFSSPLSVEERDGELLLWGADQYGLVMKRLYRFNPDGYDVEMEITFENRSDAPRSLSWELFLGPGLDRYHGQRGGQDRPEAVFYRAGELDKVKIKTAGQLQVLGPVSWIGIGDRYFLTALASGGGGLTGFARKDAESNIEVGLRSDPVTIAPRQTQSYRITAFLGPKERERLSALGLGLERSVNYGWFSWLALPFLSIMKFFYGYLRNWGLAILALTLVVKLALFPITQNMYRSMRKMQSLQPQIQALKKKFKDDSQTMQRETMALYRQYKVNPMAGCFPMLIQIPVFFALYRVLYNAIELRGASFLYIPDLSQKDPLYITPLLMGATMILQQRMSPTSADPKQARMMMFMPIIFTAMFLNFSSGLVLYFLFSNLFAIGEQAIIRKWSSRSATEVPAVSAEAAPRKGGKKKKR